MIHTVFATALALLVAQDAGQDKGPQEMQQKFERRMKELEKRFQAEREKLEKEFRASMERGGEKRERGPAPDDLGRVIRRLSERLDLLERRLAEGPMGGPPPGPGMDRDCPMPCPPGMECPPGPCDKKARKEFGKRGGMEKLRGVAEQVRRRFADSGCREKVQKFARKHGEKIRTEVKRLGMGLASCHCLECPVNRIRGAVIKAVREHGPEMRACIERFMPQRRGPGRAERFNDDNDDDDNDRGPRRQGGRRGQGPRNF